LDEKDLPHRKKITSLILEQWEEARKKIIDELKASPGRVSFTCDIWTDQQLASFLALSAHHVRKD
ncbi:hypothetical protein K466DRAFT_469428, partial [Polyporus arcularius HHB13444]